MRLITHTTRRLDTEEHAILLANGYVSRVGVHKWGPQSYPDRISNPESGNCHGLMAHKSMPMHRSLCRQSHSAITTTWSQGLVCTIDCVINVGGMLHSMPGGADACRMYVRTWRCVTTVRDRRLELMSLLYPANLRT